MTPSEQMTVPVQKSIFDLKSFEEVTVKKSVTFTPATTIEQAMASVGNDQAKFLELVNTGLRAEVMGAARRDPAGWYEVDEDDKVTSTQFSGIAANQKEVNALVLLLAKTVFKYDKSMSPEQKQESKKNAKAMIRSSEAMVNGLRENALKNVDTIEA